MKAVLDTNVLVSAFLWRGISKRIFDLARNQRLVICVNKEILEEFERVFSYPKFKNKLAEINKTPREIITEFLEVVEPYPSYFFSTPQIKVDPSDDKFLSCALVAQADVVVSGDRHLLKVRQFHGIPILTPRQFLFRMSQRKTR